MVKKLVKTLHGTFLKEVPEDKPVVTTPPTTPAPSVSTNQPKVIRDQETGKITFVEMPSGKTISGSDKELRTILEKRAALAQTPEGAVEASQIAEQQQRVETTAGIGQLTPEQHQRIQGAQVQTNPINQAQAITAGLAGASAGAAGGAVIGSAVPVVGTAIGAVAGGVVGFLGGYFTKISADKRQNVKNGYVLANEAASNMNWVISEVNAGRMPPSVAQAQFNEDLVNFYVGQQYVKQLTNSNLDEFLSGGVDELTRLNEFESRIPQLQLNLALAIQQPNPALGVYSFPLAQPET